MPRGRPIELQGNDELAALLSLLPRDRLFCQQDAFDIAQQLGVPPYRAVSWWYGAQKHGLIVRTAVARGKRGFWWTRTEGYTCSTE